MWAGHCGWYWLGKRARNHCLPLKHITQPYIKFEATESEVLNYYSINKKIFCFKGNIHPGITEVNKIIPKESISHREFRLGLPTKSMAFSYVSDSQAILVTCPMVLGSLLHGCQDSQHGEECSAERLRSFIREHNGGRGAWRGARLWSKAYWAKAT